MNEKLSTLMDGELERRDADALIKTLGTCSEHRASWDCYHLIGDVLRGEHADESARRSACAQAIFERLAEEPTVLAPANRRAVPAGERKIRIALAMAASVVTVSAIGVIALKQQQGATVVPLQLVQQVAPRPVADVKGVAVDSQNRVNDYLAIHRQFADHSAFQEASLRKSDAVKQVNAR
jgi:sigma-E factor negative regulatory protein RseA